MILEEPGKFRFTDSYCSIANTICFWLFWHTVRRWFGQDEIAFETHPLFSKKYIVLGSHEAAVRQVFNGRLLEFFEQHPGRCLEATDDRLLLYQPTKRLPPAEFPTLLESGLTVLSLIHATA